MSRSLSAAIPSYASSDTVSCPLIVAASVLTGDDDDDDVFERAGRVSHSVSIHSTLSTDYRYPVGDAYPPIRAALDQMHPLVHNTRTQNSTLTYRTSGGSKSNVVAMNIAKSTSVFVSLHSVVPYQGPASFFPSPQPSASTTT